MRRFLLVVTCILICLAVAAQGRKDIRAAGVKKVVVEKSEFKAGSEIKSVDSEVFFDSTGNEVEVIEYDDYGKVTLHEKFTWDSDNNKLSETDYYPNGKMKRVTTFTYDADGRKLTEIETDPNGKVVTRTEYIWEGEFRKERNTYDAGDRLIEKRTYIYSK